MAAGLGVTVQLRIARRPLFSSWCPARWCSSSPRHLGTPTTTMDVPWRRAAVTHLVWSPRLRVLRTRSRGDDRAVDAAVVWLLLGEQPAMVAAPSPPPATAREPWPSPSPRMRLASFRTWLRPTTRLRRCSPSSEPVRRRTALAAKRTAWASAPAVFPCPLARARRHAIVLLLILEEAASLPQALVPGDGDPGQFRP